MEKIIDEVYEIQLAQEELSNEEIEVIEKRTKIFNELYDSLSGKNRTMLCALLNSCIDRYEKKKKDMFKKGFISAVKLMKK
ncbi:MAG: hypothetical protein IJ301_05570 [Clostridia bacterium]|nr:hypothetical protein [Clostridia bacterium]